MAISLSEANYHLYGLSKPYKSKHVLGGSGAYTADFRSLKASMADNAARWPNETHNARNKERGEALPPFDFIVMC